MMKAFAMMMMMIVVAAETRAVASGVPHCQRILQPKHVRLGRCLEACDRNASVDATPCRERCTALHAAAVARIGATPRCRADSGAVQAEIAYGGEIVNPAPITSYDSGMCLDVRNGDSTNRTPIQLYHCNTTAAQDWAVQPNAIRGLASKCLDMPYATDGGGVWLFDCWGGWNQQWTLTKAVISNGTHYYDYGGIGPVSSSAGAGVQIHVGYFPNPWSYTASSELRLSDGRCLQPGWAGAMAAPCNGSVSQKWTLGPRPNGLRWNANPSYCLTATTGTTDRALYLAPCSPTDPYQRWNVGSEIRNVTGMCLTTPRGAQDWTPVQVTRCYPYANATVADQIWNIGL